MTADTHSAAPATPRLAHRDRSRSVAVGALAAAGALHLALAPAYLGHEVALFVLFAAAGAAQLLVTPRLWRGVRPVRDTLVIAATAAVLLIDIGVRNVGLPVGTAAGQPLDPTGLALALTGATALAALPMTLPPRWRFCTDTAVAAVAVGIWAVWVTGLVV